MRRRGWIIGLGLILVVLIAGSAFALTYSPPRPTPTTQPTLTPTVPAVAAREFVISKTESRINYIIQLTTTGTRIPGTLGITGRTVRFVPEADSYRLKIDALIDGTAIKSVDSFVANTLARYLEVEKYPTAGFTGDGVTLITGEDGTFDIQASGLLELHGVKRTVTIPLKVTLQQGKLSAKGSIVLDVLDYDVRIPTVIVQSKIDFEVDVVAFDSSMPVATQLPTVEATDAPTNTP